MNTLFSAVKNWAVNNYGIDIPDNKNEQIIAQINDLMAMLGINETTYLKGLHAAVESITRETIRAITVKESYFFRDTSLFSYFKQSFLPALIQKKRQQSDYQLAFWSAGCALGEEIYSVAITLTELIPDIQRWKIKLYATDINHFALDLARKGIYTRSSIRTLDATVIEKYFEKRDSFYYLHSNLRDMVTFEYGNLSKLVEQSLPYDVIFCRNVFIYLDKKSIEYALNFFYKSLTDDGVLFLSPTDLVTYCKHPFTVDLNNGIYCLRKQQIVPEIKVVLPQKKQFPPYTQKKPFNPHYTTSEKKKSEDLNTISVLLADKKYNEVLKAIDSYKCECGENALLLRYQGEALIGMADHEKALHYLQKSIELNALDATSHFFKGLAEIDVKQSMKAIESLKKALYLKPTFPEALYYLGLLYVQSDQKERGIKLLENALSQVRNTPNADVNDEQISAAISYYREENNGY